ncbi:golgin subfamily A member 6-like protein 22 [Papaver somniferum]|uniref:golgin subfamily A member 6-like protein 22 n=1 Tax=Papaver somniferum TaxID=3469 RepID=UPI000E6F6C93|nr:golgin subfamily A member 6-like protein 22 [Papaver somniferum]
MVRAPDRARHVIASRRSKRIEARRGRMERARTSSVRGRQEENRRQTDEDGLREGLMHTSDTDTVVEEEMTSEDMEENIGEENMTLDQLRETLHRERERDRDLVEQQVQLGRHNSRLRQQNRQLNENMEINSIDSEGNTISSEEDKGGRRRRRRTNEDEERDLRRALEISQWEDHRRRHEEEKMQEEELQRRANLIRDEEERRRPGEGRLSVIRGRHHEEDGGNLNQEVLNELRDMRALINNSRRGGRVQLAEAIEEADKSPFTYEIMHTDILEKCVLPTLESIFSRSEKDILDDVHKQQLVEARDRDTVQLEEKANTKLAGVGHEM